MALLGISEYGTSSSSDSDSKDSAELGIRDPDSDSTCGALKMKLPPPDLDCNDCSPTSESIFHNPYSKEYKLNIDTLSRHVMPSESKEKQEKRDPPVQIKICRKFAVTGKCRFGDKCKFSHAGTKEYSATTKHSARSRHDMSEKGRLHSSRPMLIGDLDGLFDEDAGTDCSKRKRKRPGLAHNLIPSKKALDMYNRFSKS